MIILENGAPELSQYETRRYAITTTLCTHMTFWRAGGAGATMPVIETDNGYKARIPDNLIANYGYIEASATVDDGNGSADVVDTGRFYVRENAIPENYAPDDYESPVYQGLYALIRSMQSRMDAGEFIGETGPVGPQGDPAPADLVVPAVNAYIAEYLRLHPEATIDEDIIRSAVNAWLANHPEYVTTVMDNSISAAKLTAAVRENVEAVPGLKQDFDEYSLKKYHVNEINPAKLVEGREWNNDGKTSRERAGYALYEDKITVKNGDIIRARNFSTNPDNTSRYSTVRLYNSAGTFLTSANVWNIATTGAVVAHEDASYALVTFRYDDYFDLSKTILTVNRELPSEFVPYTAISMSTLETDALEGRVDNLDGLFLGAVATNRITIGGTKEWNDVEKEITQTADDRFFGRTLPFTKTNVPEGHKYYYGGFVKFDTAPKLITISTVNTLNQYPAMENLFNIIENPQPNTYYYLSNTATVSTGSNYPNIAGDFGKGVSSKGVKMTIKKGMVIDLTAVFGEGNEPDHITVKNLLSAYEDYWFPSTGTLFSSNILKNLYRDTFTKETQNNSYRGYGFGKYGFTDEAGFFAEAPIDPELKIWSAYNGRYAYGLRNNSQVKVHSPNDFKGSVATNGMLISYGKEGAWTSLGSGENSYGGHVFQGWNELGTFRLSAMIGNTRVGGMPREDEGALLVYSPSDCFDNPTQDLTDWQLENRMTPNPRDRYGGNPKLLLGRLRIGTDEDKKGLLVERDRSTQFGDFIVSDGTHYRKLVFNANGTVTWTEVTDNI